MSTFINNLQNVMTPELILYIGSALVVVIVLTIVLRGLKKRGLKSNLVDLERQYNEIKGEKAAGNVHRTSGGTAYSPAQPRPGCQRGID